MLTYIQYKVETIHNSHYTCKNYCVFHFFQILMSVLLEPITVMISLACAIIQWVVMTVAASLVTLDQAPLAPVMVGTMCY